jgi:archaellum biogenesis ATPase FlaH
LDREEPWLRYDESHPLHVRIKEDGRKPAYPLVGNFPTLICAATIAGEGEVRAVAKIVFEIIDGESVNTKPVIIDPRTGEPFKNNKRVRGVMEDAGVFLGQHLGGDTIVVTEGVEDGMCAVMAGFPAVAKLNAETLERLKLPSPIKRVVLAGDNDKAGRDGVNRAAKSYHARGYAVAIVKLPEGVKDLNEMLKEHGVSVVHGVLVEAAAWEVAPGEPKNALLEFADDVQLPMKAQYLVKYLLGRGDLGVIYGPPAAGKSFLALHLAGCIALGRSFAGRRAKAAPVLYVGLEGEVGMRRRMMALKTTMVPFGKMLARMCPSVLLRQDEAGNNGEKLLIDAIANLREGSDHDVGLVVIDTLWRAMAGDDDNSAKDMGKFLARLKRIQDQTGVAILLVHHSGKDAERGMRGSSSLLGAVDVVMKVDDKVITVEKNKDGPTSVRQSAVPSLP